jgi:hypothetical protein
MADQADYLRNKKPEHVKGDCDRARSLRERLDARISSIRTWNLTVIVAYLGWMTRRGGTHNV